MRSKADETFVIVETLICPLQIFSKKSFLLFADSNVTIKNQINVNSDSNE